MPKAIIGIDPGAMGYISEYHSLLSEPLKFIKYKDKWGKIVKVLKQTHFLTTLENMHRGIPKADVIVYIEEKGFARNSKAVSTIGGTWHTLLSTLLSNDYIVEIARVRIWKKEFGLTSDKELSLEAYKLFTEHTAKSHDLAEAWLIAKFGFNECLRQLKNTEAQNYFIDGKYVGR